MTFAYRCYSCGIDLGTGIPPVEALSFSQRAAIGETDGTGLRMDGLSGYSFCEFCLLFEEFFGHMDRMEIPEDKRFADYGSVLNSDTWVSDMPLGNWTLMAMGVGGAQNLPTYLYDMWYDRRTMVMQREIEIAADNKEREMEAAKLHNRIKKQVRLYFRMREKVPYHLEQGVRNLWFALTMPKTLDEEDQMDLYETLAWESQNWQYENRISDPFARFELWTIDFTLNRFIRNYEEN